MFNILKAFILVAGLAQATCFSYNNRRIVEKCENWIRIPSRNGYLI